MVKEIKKPATYDFLVQKLEDRGCIIPDKSFCRKKLAAINYYRLTAYFLPFKRLNGQYRSDTTFLQVYRIYEFDRKLRGILLAALEEVEIYLRSFLSYFHSHKYGSTGYLNPDNFSGRHNHEKFMLIIEREIQNNEDVLFVKHHLTEYDGVFPLWVLVELFTFGMTSYFFNDLKNPDQKKLATEIFSSTAKNVTSWLRCCTDLRNICAHYGRLYYRIFPAVPAGLNLPKNAERRLWGAVMALKSLYPDSEKWNNEVVTVLEALIDEYQEDISLYHLAFPADWKNQLRAGTM